MALARNILKEEGVNCLQIKIEGILAWNRLFFTSILAYYSW